MLKYTLAFLIHWPTECVLMLYRNNPPNQFMWNGVGGKIEPGENPKASALREIKEETGIVLNDLTFGGTVTWGDSENDGMYLYFGEVRYADIGESRETPEGWLEWKPMFALNAEDSVVVPNIRQFFYAALIRSLVGHTPWRYHTLYDNNGEYAGVTAFPLSAERIAEATR